MLAQQRSKRAAVPKPLHDLLLMENKVRLLAYGKPYDWSLRPYTDQATPQELMDLDPSLYLPQITRDCALGKMLYAPSPREFNAQMCTEAEVMRTRVTLESKIFKTSVILFRGANADGIILSSGHTYAVSAAGCPLIIVRDRATGVTGVAHAGMRSLIDEGRLKGEDSRRHESIVLSFFEAMRAQGVQSLEQVGVTIAFPINPQDFTYSWDDQIFGTINQKRTEDLVERWGEAAIYGYTSSKGRRLGRPDLSAIIKSQCVSLGVPPTNIKVVLPPPKKVWNDTRQDENTLVRNLILVQHISSTHH